MKVDVSLIEGYEAMTPEQKIEALLKFEMDPTKNGFRTQADFDKVMSENAEKKKRIKELETQAGTEKDGLTKRLEELEKNNKELQRANLVASTTAQFIGMGYEEALAKEAAEASADGDMTRLFTAQQKFLKTHDEKLKAEALKGMKPPQGGAGGNDEKSYGDKFAETIGKSVAASQKASADVLSQYQINY